MNYHRYTICKLTNIWFSNMVRCRAIKELDCIHILEDIFSGEIPF